MFGRKTGFFAVMAVALMLFGGCGTDGQMTDDQKRQATDWYNNMVNGDGGTNTSGGDAYWDGYGVNDGRAMTNDRNNTERNTYGMRTDGTNAGTTLGEDIRNAWDNVKDTVTGNDNAGGNNTGTNNTGNKR